MAGKNRIVSGMRPTGRLHLGHYFGALINWLKLQETHECFFMVADYHALTTGDLSKTQLKENSREILLDWLSVGIDPEKATVFIQSSVPEHAELYLLFNMVVSVGWLERNPTYKEQRQELGEKATSSLGLLGYPVLQTVDICMYKATQVPVGEDQKPHLELGRELVRRFNTTFKKNIFPEFEALLTPTSKLVGLDGRKMSKSYGNAIDLADSPDVVRKKVSRMLTDTQRPRREDPGHPDVCPVFWYHQIFTPSERVSQIASDCRAAILSCGDDKKALAETLVAWLEPIQRRRAEYQKDPGYLDELMRRGAEKAGAIASTTMRQVWETVGLWSPRLR